MPILDHDTLGPYRKPWLLPVLLAQGRLVKLRALKLPEPAGERSGSIEGPGPAYSLLVVGDSAAAGVGVASQEQALGPTLARALAARLGRAVRWQVLARTGLASTDMDAFLEDHAGALAQAPERIDLVVTSIGVNDAVRLTPSPAFEGAMQRLLSKLRLRAGPEVRFVLGRCPPLHVSPLFRRPLRGLVAWRIERINALLENLAVGSPDIRVASEPREIDRGALASDGFHPNAASYVDWARHLCELAIESAA